jgi:urease accessory protein
MMLRWAIVAVLVLLTAPAHAHVGQPTGFSMAGGFAHPFAGLDHLAAMVAVGLWAAMAGGRRMWIWPLAFVAAMLGGGFLGQYGVALPVVEPAIAASVAVLGLLVASGVGAPVSIGAVLIGLFAVFHGHAHGTEAPADGWAGYAAGFVLATALLHLAGITLGAGLQRAVGALPLRGLGLATALFGASLLMP